MDRAGYQEATPKCPRVDVVESAHGRGMGGKSRISTECKQELVWIHGLHGYGSWHCPQHGHIDEARPHTALKGDSREGYAA